MKTSDLIYVAGHTGLIGSAVVRRLESSGFSNLLLPKHADLELTEATEVNKFFEKERPSYVFLAAGKVGGILQNRDFPMDFMTTNLGIQLNVLGAAAINNVRGLIMFGSSCMYPRECEQPMSEDTLLSGKPEPTSIAYAMSKLAGMHMCLAYNRQNSNQKFIPIIPNSAFGPNDNFNEESGHVLSVLLRRFHKAKERGDAEVIIWGSGTPRREFVYSDDIADAAIYLMRNVRPNTTLPINVGSGSDLSVKDLASQIAKVVGFSGAIKLDRTKPDGAPRKLLDSSRINALGWAPKISFLDGLNKTYEWYKSNV